MYGVCGKIKFKKDEPLFSVKAGTADIMRKFVIDVSKEVNKWIDKHPYRYSLLYPIQWEDFTYRFDNMYTHKYL